MLSPNPAVRLLLIAALLVGLGAIWLGVSWGGAREALGGDGPGIAEEGAGLEEPSVDALDAFAEPRSGRLEQGAAPGEVASATAVVGPSLPGLGPRRLRLEGVVKDRAGAPLAGATVEALATLESEILLIASAVSGSDGRYVVPLPSLERYLGRRTENYVWVYCRALAEGHEVMDDLLGLGDEDGMRIEWDVTLEGAESYLRGRVVDAAGMPVRDADVLLNAGESWDERTRTEDDGRFEMVGQRAQTGTSVRVRHPVHGTASFVVQESTPGPYFDIGTIAFVERAVLSGRVLDGAQKGVPGRRVFAAANDGGARDGQRVFTGFDGAFRFADLEPGRTYAVTYDGAPLVSRRVRAPESGLVLWTQDYSSVIRIVDEMGAPVFGLNPKIKALGESTERAFLSSIDEATFLITSKTPGSVRFSAHEQVEGGWLSGGLVLDLGAGPAERQLIVRKAVDHAVSVRLKDTLGQPMDDWYGRLYHAETGEFVDGHDGPQGFTRLPEGPYRLHVAPRAARLAVPFELEFTVEPGVENLVEGAAEVTGGLYEVLLLGAAEDDLRGLRVYASSGGQRGRRVDSRSLKPAEPTPGYRALAPGSYVFVIYSWQGKGKTTALAERTAKIAAGETTRVEFDLRLLEAGR